MASEAAAEAAAFVQQLVARGITQKTIGDAIGRNDSLISQIRRGTGKGASLRDRLAELVATAEEHGLGREATPEQLAGGGQEPARRTRKSGTVARVRKAVSVRYNGGGSSSSVKQQAAQQGGNGLMYELERAYREGKQVAFDVTFRDPGDEVQVIESSGRPRPKATKKAGGHKRHGLTVTINPETARAYNTCRRLNSVTAGVLQMMLEDGLITWEDLAKAHFDVLRIDMRVW